MIIKYQVVHDNKIYQVVHRPRYELLCKNCGSTLRKEKYPHISHSRRNKYLRSTYLVPGTKIAKMIYDHALARERIIDPGYLFKSHVWPMNNMAPGSHTKMATINAEKSATALPLCCGTTSAGFLRSIVTS